MCAYIRMWLLNFLMVLKVLEELMVVRLRCLTVLWAVLTRFLQMMRFLTVLRAVSIGALFLKKNFDHVPPFFLPRCFLEAPSCCYCNLMTVLPWYCFFGTNLLISNVVSLTFSETLKRVVHLYVASYKSFCASRFVCRLFVCRFVCRFVSICLSMRWVVCQFVYRFLSIFVLVLFDGNWIWKRCSN